MLSPALVALSRDAFVIQEESETTVDFAGLDAATSLEGLDLDEVDGRGPQATDAPVPSDRSHIGRDRRGRARAPLRVLLSSARLVGSSTRGSGGSHVQAALATRVPATSGSKARTRGPSA